MSYYQENRPAMGGLADALAMQGRLGDSTLVHMNPMEVRMLETMSPDGRLSINPETGLPEAFKLKDVAAFALPIAASIAAPYLLPAIGVTGLSGVAAGAIGAGVGGFGSGLIQGKGLKDSLVQGGISGLMSYGMGSLMAPGTMTGGAEAIQGGVTSTPPLGADSMGLGGYSAAQEAAVTQGLGAAGIGAPDGSSLIAPGTPTSGLANVGLNPSGSVPYTGAADVYKPGTSETGLGQIFDRASRTSPFGSTAFDGSQLGPTQLPTYTQIGGSVLGSAGQMALDGMLSPEEMPYDIAGMDDMDAYYASRIPDLEAGRRRGEAAARGLNYPPSGGTAADYYRMATSPGGFGTFYAADGGRVPKDVDINGQPHQLSYINQEEANLLKNLGGSGREVFGIPAYLMGGEEGMGADGESNGTADGMGVGGYSDAQAAAVTDSMTAMADMASVGMDPMGVVGNVNDPGQAATMGVGASQNLSVPINAPPPNIGMLGRGAMGLFGLSQKGFSVDPDMTYSTITGIGPPGIGSAIANAANINTSLATVTGPTTSPGGGDIGDDDGGVGDAGGDSGVYGRPYGDPYNTKKAQATMSPSPAGATALRSLSLTAPRTAGDIYNAATTSGIPRFFTSMAQGGGVSSLAYGGEAAPVGFANKAFEGMVPGQGTGMSDDIPFSIEGNQPALLSRDEYVLPADVVSQLGDGSSGAGADMLDNFISQVRQTKYGNTQQPAPVGPQLMTGLMRQGGVV